MKYYDIHVEIPRQGYSIGLKSKIELTDDEIITKLIELEKFEERTDSQFVDSIEEISEEEFNEWF